MFSSPLVYRTSDTTKNKASEDLAINGRKKKTLMKSGSFVIEDIIKNKLKYITLKTMTIKGISLFF